MTVHWNHKVQSRRMETHVAKHERALAQEAQQHSNEVHLAKLRISAVRDSEVEHGRVGEAHVSLDLERSQTRTQTYMNSYTKNTHDDELTSDQTSPSMLTSTSTGRKRESEMEEGKEKQGGDWHRGIHSQRHTVDEY